MTSSRSLPIAARVAAMLRRIRSACWATSPSISSPVAGFWATCPDRKSSPPPRTATENGRPDGGSLSLVTASRGMVSEFLSVGWLSAGWVLTVLAGPSPRGGLERGADDLQAQLKFARCLVAEAGPDDVGAVAEPGTCGDLRPLPRQVCVEPVDVRG